MGRCAKRLWDFLFYICVVATSGNGLPDCKRQRTIEQVYDARKAYRQAQERVTEEQERQGVCDGGRTRSRARWT